MWGKNCGCMRAMRLFLEIDATDLSLLFISRYTLSSFFPYDIVNLNISRLFWLSLCFNLSLSLFFCFYFLLSLCWRFQFFSPFFASFCIMMMKFLGNWVKCAHCIYMQQQQHHSLNPKGTLFFSLSRSLFNKLFFLLSNVFYSLNLHDMCLFFSSRGTLEYAIFSIKFFFLSFYPYLLSTELLWKI